VAQTYVEEVNLSVLQIELINNNIVKRKLLNVQFSFSLDKCSFFNVIQSSFFPLHKSKREGDIIDHENIECYQMITITGAFY